MQGTPPSQKLHGTPCKRDSQPVFEKLADIFVSFQHWDVPAERPSMAELLSSEVGIKERITLHPDYPTTPFRHLQTSELRRLEPAQALLPIFSVSTTTTSIATVICISCCLS